MKLCAGHMSGVEDLYCNAPFPGGLHRCQKRVAAGRIEGDDPGQTDLQAPGRGVQSLGCFTPDAVSVPVAGIPSGANHISCA